MRFFRLLILLTIPAVTFAQSQSVDCGCNAALAKDTISVFSSEKQQYAFLKVIDKETYESYKSSGGFGISVPIVDAIVKASANWDDFQQRREKYLETVGYKATAEQIYQELQIVTSPVAYKFWSECMSACARRNIGLFAWKEEEDKESVAIVVYYHGAPGASAASLDTSLLGGTVAGVPKGRLFPKKTVIENNGSLSKLVQRNKAGETVKATVGAAGFTDLIWGEWADSTSTNSAKLILERPSTIEKKVEDRCGASGWTNNNHDKDCEGSPCSPDGKWRASIRTVTITAPAGHALKNPRNGRCWSRCYSFSCLLMTNLENCPDGSGKFCYQGGYCPWSGVDSTVATSNQITWSYRAWSGPIIREFCSDLVRIETQTVRDEQPVAIPATGSFVLEVSPHYTSAVLNYQINGTPGVMKVGDKTSADGKLSLVTTIPPTGGGGSTYFQYKIN